MGKKYFYVYFKVNIKVIFTHKELVDSAKTNEKTHTQKGCNFNIVTTNKWVKTLHIHAKLGMAICNKYHI